MQPITSLEGLANHVRSLGRVTRIAVAAAEDANTLESLARASSEGFVHGILLGSKSKIESVCDELGLDSSGFEIINTENDAQAATQATQMVKEGQADVLMKGLVNTDVFLKAVLNKEKGLLPPKAVMSYVCALELPKYHKLLFISDTAVLTNPDLNQKIAMVNYSVVMARRFGIEKPKAALISATEKVTPGLPNTLEYAQISKMASRGQIKNCIVDGPLDVFLACDPAAAEIKGIESPIAGDADILVFPNLESANSFYKGLMLWAGGELAGLIQGTLKPVVVMSRSESAASKYYCVALSCLMAGEK
ncbi:MAG: phosphate acetyltransferase [Candidatus Cloacimonetes bacterium]|nr:phosphate acetyltransferase [Candidatus Cloacimonadota bacterium]